ncbi:hypothetical protein HSB1_06160 [Halogranum salarium B-1]|uniref:Uncharacterized protein n=2 Tax=Halogranum rubrum TaxID=553466 RepID=J2ZLF0_9EURY|nr:hypothetical protein HSB1_06160 [Halogranum salarium B-1]
MKLADQILLRAINQRVFATAYSHIRKRIKAFLTRRDKIKSDLQFSVYLQPDDAYRVNSCDKYVDQLTANINRLSNGEAKVEDVKWDTSQTEADLQVSYASSRSPYNIRLNFIGEVPPDTTAFDSHKDAKISSVGVTVEFEFAFAKLKSSIIDLSGLVQTIQESLSAMFPIRTVTNGRFVVYPLENDLTLDEWIQKEQFDVSLLLESDDQKRSVKFHGDRAEITSPNTKIDNETVEYIRATLLNYYL